MTVAKGGQLLISFYGDDFTGSTDAMESLAMAGLRTVLFTEPPNAVQLAWHKGLQAFGVAGQTRSMAPADMERVLRPVLAGLRDCGAPVVHYKVCSTFDSSPRIGSIGCVIDVGMKVFASRFVPLLVGAPALGRYCIFGNLFARCGAESAPFRLDRHPSMSKHPTTPMDEADLRLHLAKQTGKSIALFDILHVGKPVVEAERDFEELLKTDPKVVLIDMLYDSQLATAGRLIFKHASAGRPLFVVGSSGVEAALSAYWRQAGQISLPSEFAKPTPAGPIVVVSGSCSPVTAGQVEWALANGFAEVALDSPRLVDESAAPSVEKVAIAAAVGHLRAGRSVIVHTGRGPNDARIPQVRSALKAGGLDDLAAATRSSQIFGASLGRILRAVLEAVRIRRAVVAGGDTAGAVARTVGIESMEMIAELTAGSPLCRATAPASPADGLEITFKGGQIGKIDFLGLVRDGR